MLSKVLIVDVFVGNEAGEHSHNVLLDKMSLSVWERTNSLRTFGNGITIFFCLLFTRLYIYSSALDITLVA